MNNSEQLTVNSYISDLKKIDFDIQNKKKEMNDLKKRKNQLKLLIWNECEHNWIRDRDLCSGDYPKHYCSKCLLWNDKRLYQ